MQERLGGPPTLSMVAYSPRVLPRQEFENHLRQGDIKIVYHFDPGVDPPAELPEEQRVVDPDEPDRPATRAFAASFFGDRLGLTLGPLVLSHAYRSRRGRTKYKNLDGVFDLRRTAGTIRIAPRESITVNTIESIGLTGTLAATTLPRLTQATAGMVLSASYIDPWWSGLPVLHMVNLAGRPIDLRFGERIAVTRVYPTAGAPLAPSTRERFAEKSHHFGLGWERILSSDADPFPMRKRTVAPNRVQRLVGSTDHVARRLAGFGLTGVGVLAGAFWLGGLNDRVDRTQEDVRRVQDAVRTEQRRADRLELQIEALMRSAGRTR